MFGACDHAAPRGSAIANANPPSASSLSHGSDAEPADGMVVPTDRGAVRGKRTGEVYAYLGIPYATPPVGALRWKATRVNEAWQGVRDATAFGPTCPQLDFDGKYAGGSEDCLTLNVWTPATAPKTPLPVLFYMHGGYNVMGSASQARDGAVVLDGSYVAEHGPAVVVTIQYRLGNLGFLAQRALDAEDPSGLAGNYGLLDQIAALQWVQRNIARFGGDPTRVLVHGYSAGSIDTCSLVVSPLAKGLFSRAAMHSWPCVALPRVDQENDGDRYATTIGCADAHDVAQCMRDKPVEMAVSAGASLGASGSIHHGATIDGYVITESPYDTIAAGKHNHMPLIIGTTSAEFETLIKHTPLDKVHSEDDYNAALKRMFPKKLAAVSAMYPVSAFSSAREALVALQSDRIVVCPEKRVARLASASQSEPVRVYVFTHAFEGPGFLKTPHGHGVDVPFLFHTLATQHYAGSPSELALSDAMVGDYVRFAASGDPNANAPTWPAYDATTDTYLVLDDAITTANGYHAKECAFWDAQAPDAVIDGGRAAR